MIYLTYQLLAPDQKIARPTTAPIPALMPASFSEDPTATLIPNSATPDTTASPTASPALTPLLAPIADAPKPPLIKPSTAPIPTYFQSKLSPSTAV
ncbi:hypothetical protein [Vibrio sp. CyArs1]|uniref:hypothetical protein n=1 Tax=Vibrio sp. CyArs1 TaxID=2682577 RepID=UPI001F05633F|nr:hypothetical protein [Vibrio sp. CyArs1]